MEIKTTEEIFHDRKNEWSFSDEACQKYYHKKWVSVESLETWFKEYRKKNGIKTSDILESDLAEDILN